MMKVLRNKRGDVPIPSAIMVVVFAMVIAAALYIAYVYIQTTNVRNAMNKGLSNLAVTISEDTYAALRESNFDEYAHKLTSTSAYRHSLETKYKQDVLSSVELDNDRYRIDNISLDFEVNGKKIVYTCTCDVTFYAEVFGNTVPAAANALQVFGSHTAKYGR
ncbi:MAG: hypothetical protein J6Q17_02190 [Clostridia bacterium]|nr:hypothetical protein [Clostridia bacterium]